MLTPRQRQIAELYARGKSCKVIARRLGVTVRTVEWHIEEAARRIPGSGRLRERIIAWYLSTDDS